MTNFASAILLVLAGFYIYIVKAGDRRLDKYPGPFLARWTTLYRKYFETVKNGEWVDEVERLHLIYGPIVRVGPRELHFSNPEAYNDIYAVGSKFKKDPETYAPVSCFLHLFGVLEPQEALIRRAIIQPYFSKRSVTDRAWIVQQKVDNFLDTLLKHTKDKSPFDLEYTLRPFFATAIAMFAFPDLEQCNALATSGLISSVTEAPDRNTIWFWMKNLHPIIVKILTSTTTRVSSREMDALKILADDAIQSSTTDFDAANANFFHALLQRSGVRCPDEPRNWLAAEALNLKFAGVDTTANPVFFAIRGVLGNDKVQEQLIHELNNVWPDLASPPPALATLEKLPYLTAVIKEGLRLSIGVITPMNRVVGPDDTIISGEFIPAGTVVGMSNTFIHFHHDLFPEPHVFKPERWLQEDSQKLEKHFVVFSRGPRSCVGMHFAWCMMHTLLANMFRKLKLSPISVDDVRAPFHLKDDFVSVYVGKPVHVHVEREQN